MPLLDITRTRLSLQIHPGTLRAQSLTADKALSSSLSYRNDMRSFSPWKSLNLPIKLHGNVGSPEIRRARVFVRAVATFETKSLVKKQDERKDSDNSRLGIDSSPRLQPESVNEDSEEMDEDEREELRRKRISKANKGKTPWNKGKKHSAETIRRIKERTWIAMQDPKIKMKLAHLGHPQSDETKDKIGAGVKRGWEKRHRMMFVQQFCCFEWQNLIAEASRIGCVGQEELQWDSYAILSEQLEKEWLKDIDQRNCPKPITCRRGPKTPEQRKKIAETIAAKWADPEYRERVLAGIAKRHEATVGGERKPRRKPSTSSNTKKKKKVIDTLRSYEFKAKSETKKVRKYKPQYKDPFASSKLEMIKNIRAQRAAEIRKNEAIEQTRLLIAKAEKAAKVLELAAERSPLARSSLVETRKLLAEAMQSIESLQSMQITNKEYNDEEIPDPSNESSSHVEELSDASNESSSDVEEDGNDEHINHTETRHVNGTKTLAPSSREEFGYGKISMQDIFLTDGFDFVSKSSLGRKNSLPLVHIEPEENKNCFPNGVLDPTLDRKTQPVAKTKKWVRGKLVEVSEEDEDLSS